MKKTGLLFVVVLVAAVIVWKVSQQKGIVNEFSMSNVEALASGEGGGRGCTLDRNAICETSHADYIDYRNN